MNIALWPNNSLRYLFTKIESILINAAVLVAKIKIYMTDQKEEEKKNATPATDTQSKEPEKPTDSDSKKV